MSLLIFDEHPLMVDKKLAKKIGLNQAMVLQQVHYWLENNKKANRNFHQERYWTYNTMDAWQEEFPFWSKETVRRTFDKLRKMGLLVVGNFNRYKMDRTIWYSIDYDALGLCMDTECGHLGSQNEQMEENNLTSAIPETSTETSTEIYNQSVSHVEIEKETDRLTDGEEDLEEECQKIIDRCELYGLDENYREAADQAIRILVYDSRSKKRLKIGDNYYPSKIVRKNLQSMDFSKVLHGINKFKEASSRYKIRNNIAYLKACIFNAVSEMKIEVDSSLRFAGLI